MGAAILFLVLILGLVGFGLYARKLRRDLDRQRAQRKIEGAAWEKEASLIRADREKERKRVIREEKIPWEESQRWIKSEGFSEAKESIYWNKVYDNFSLLTGRSCFTVNIEWTNGNVSIAYISGEYPLHGASYCCELYSKPSVDIGSGCVYHPDLDPEILKYVHPSTHPKSTNERTEVIELTTGQHCFKDKDIGMMSEILIPFLPTLADCGLYAIQIHEQNVVLSNFKGINHKQLLAQVSFMNAMVR